MSKALAKLLDKPEEIFAPLIKKFEDLSGYPSEDVRLLVEVEHQTLKKIAALHMDPTDTRGEELFFGLREKGRRDEAKFSGDLGLLPNEADFNENLQKIFAGLIKNQDVWVIKKSVAKDLLLKHPPKRLMKILRYRTVDSMLKREGICELYAALPFVESPRWLNVFHKDQSGLTPTDFEPKTAEIISMPFNKWQGLKGTRRISEVPALGAIALWPKRHDNLSGLNIALRLSAAITNFQTWSAAAQKALLEENFASLAGKKSFGNLAAFDVLKNPITWSALFKYHSKNTKSSALNELPFELGKTTTPVELLAAIYPGLKWWSDSNFLGKGLKDQPVSLNLADILKDMDSEATYKSRTAAALSSSLWDELVCRYLKYPGVESFILGRLHSNSPTELDFESDISNITSSPKIEWA